MSFKSQCFNACLDEYFIIQNPLMGCMPDWRKRDISKLVNVAAEIRAIKVLNTL